MKKPFALLAALCAVVLMVAGCAPVPEGQEQDGVVAGRSASVGLVEKIADDGGRSPAEVLGSTGARYQRSLAHNRGTVEIDARVVIPEATALEQIALGKRAMDIHALLSICLGDEAENAVLVSDDSSSDTVYAIKDPSPPKDTTDRLASVEVSPDGRVSFEDRRRSINGSEVEQKDAPNCSVDRDAALQMGFDFLAAMEIGDAELDSIAVLEEATEDVPKGGGYDIDFRPCFNGLPNCQNVLTNEDHTTGFWIQVTGGGVCVFQSQWIPEVVSHEPITAMIAVEEACDILERALGSAITRYPDTPIDAIVLSTFWHLGQDGQVMLLPAWSFYSGTELEGDEDRVPFACHIDAQSGQILAIV